MIGAIVGDIIGSRFEKKDPPVSSAFSLFTDNSIFTDDTILSVAVCDALMNGKGYGTVYRQYYKRYPHAGYGSAFKTWASMDDGVIANSFGNGSAMRVSPVAWAYDNIEDVMAEAEKSAMPSHNHEEGIKGAKAIAVSTFLARKSATKAEIKERMTAMGYDIYGSVSSDRPKFSSACSVTVPQAIWAFLESDSFEDSIKKAVMIGGDADTLASMAGAISHAYYGINSIDRGILEASFSTLTKDLFEMSKQFIVEYVWSDFDIQFAEKEQVAEEGFGFLFV